MYLLIERATETKVDSDESIVELMRRARFRYGTGWTSFHPTMTDGYLVMIGTRPEIVAEIVGPRQSHTMEG